MKKTTIIKAWFVRFVKPDKETLLEMGKDIRTLSLAVMTATFLGLAIDSKETPIPLEMTLVFGIISWFYGIILTRIANTK